MTPKLTTPAIRREDYDAVKAFIDEDPSIVTIARDWNNTPLHQACMEGNAKIVELLLLAQSDPSARNKWNNMPIHLAAGNGKWEIVVMLCRRDESLVEAAGNLGCTPVIIASGNGHRDTVDALLQCGAVLTSTDDEGDSALHYAAIKGKTKTCKFLVQMGASLNVINSQRQSAVQVARDEAIRNALVNTPRVAPQARIDISGAVSEKLNAGLTRQQSLFMEREFDDTGEMRAKKD